MPMSAGRQHIHTHSSKINSSTYDGLSSVYSPAFPPVKRDKFKLDLIEPKLYRNALRLAAAIQAEWIQAGKIYIANKSRWGKSLIKQFQDSESRSHDQLELLKKVIATKCGEDDGVKIRIRQTELNRFNKTAQNVCSRLTIKYSDDLVSLAALFSTRSYRGKKALLKKLPDNLIDLNSPESLRRSRIILRCVLSRKLKIKTAADLEDYKGLSKAVISCGLASLTKKLSPLQIIETAYPGITEGRDPVIRPWKIQEGTKWIGEDGLALSKKAAAWLLEFETGVYDRSKSSFDIEKIKNIRWIDAIEKAGMKKIIELCPALNNVLDVIKMGAEQLGEPNLVGMNQNQLHPWDVRRLGMWHPERGGHELLDQLTRYLVENVLRKEAPYMFSENGTGAIIPQEVKKYSCWSQMYNSLASDCLKNTRLTVPQALFRAYPEIFGWQTGQIGFWEMRYKGKWNGNEGTRLFRQAFAHALFRSGLGEYNNSNGNYSVSVENFLVWIKKRESQGKDLLQIIPDYGLTGGIKLSAADSSLFRAINILFTAEPGKAGFVYKPDLKMLFLSHLESLGGLLVINFGPPVFNKSAKSELAEKTVSAQEEAAIQAELLKKRTLRFRDELLKKTSLDPFVDNYRLSEFIDSLLVGDMLHMAALFGLRNYSEGLSRADVYGLRRNYNFKSLFIEEDQINLDLQ